MTPSIKKIIHKGKTYYTVGDAARYLGTTATKVRVLLGTGALESEQLRVNGKLLVTAESLVRQKYGSPTQA